MVARSGYVSGDPVFARHRIYFAPGSSWLAHRLPMFVNRIPGLVNADLLSLAMFVGWSQSGIPWRNALGLVLLSMAAIVLPIAARSNHYCAHLCPHGALQQILPRRWKSKKPLSPWLHRTLLTIRPLLIIWVILVAMTHIPFSLVDIEPFDAYAWRAAAWPTLAVAIAGIAASFRIPMPIADMDAQPVLSCNILDAIAIAIDGRGPTVSPWLAYSSH